MGPENFGSQKFLGPENLGSPKIWGPKNFGPKILRLKKILVQEYFVEIFITQNSFIQKFFVQNILGKKIFWMKKTLVQKKFRPTKF